ncbi:coiled-coil domain-containing protein 38 isoform X2 [Struthio camelus]|uniref:coiled-coil domain-containing protein 38 isoform X2 n=1 Tax=Struthio camelus TaxID=8801 RepID=UPI00051E1889|nr:PREDICTED: coiled-coil domain-containing protein 38 isoform X2 [Struthio camelus australis]
MTSAALFPVIQPQSPATHKISFDVDKNIQKKITPFTVKDGKPVLYRDAESWSTEKMQDKKAQKNLKLHEKSTLSSRMKTQNFTKHVISAFERKTQIKEEKDVCFPISNWAVAFAKCCQSDKQPITEYISEQKDLFLQQYAVTEKKQTVKHLEELTVQKEKEARSAEEKLEKEFIAFEEFLGRNSISAINAFRNASKEKKSKMKMATYVKSAVKEICTLRSEISDAEFLLQESLHYEAFLMELSPKDWQEQQKAKRMEARAEKEKENNRKELVTCHFSLQEGKDAQNSQPLPCWAKPTTIMQTSKQKGKPVAITEKSAGYKKKMLTTRETGPQKTVLPLIRDDSRYFKLGLEEGAETWNEFRSGSTESRASSPRWENRMDSVTYDFPIEDVDCDVVPEIYFTDPKQLLQIFHDLEEQNLALIRTIQDLGETVDEIAYTTNAIKENLADKIRILARHKEVLEAACIREEEKSTQLALKTKVFSVGEFSSEIQDRMLDLLNEKIAEVYKFSVGTEAASNLSSIQMLKRIEDRIEELCELMETIPREVIERAEKRKMNEKRKRLRELKLKQEKELQTERLKSSLQRAISEPKKKTGRRLVFRSQPPAVKAKKVVKDEVPANTEDDSEFFT